MAHLADQYKDACDLRVRQATNKGKTSFSKNADQGKKPDWLVRTRANLTIRFIPESECECYKCHKFGHIAPECSSKTPSNRMSHVHNTETSEQQVCYISTIPTDTIVDTTASRSPVTTSLSCKQSVVHNIPIFSRVCKQCTRNSTKGYRMQRNCSQEK